MIRRAASPTLFLALVATLVVAAFSIGGSLALFTDTDSVPGNTFTTAASFGLASNGLVDRYFIEEAASGQGPTELVDAAPSPLNLPITYDGTNPTYKELSTGRGWESTTVTNQGRASILVDGTKIQTMLDGSSKGTIELVLDVNAVNSSSSRLIHIGAGSESGYFTLRSPNLNQLDFQMFGDGFLRGRWDPDFATSGRIVLHLVYDSTLSTAADRVKLYKDGALLTKIGGTDPPQNETISIPNGKNFVIANRELCCRSFDGDIYYAAHYNAALTAAEVSNNSDILLANDDSAPVSFCTAGDTGFLNPSAEAADTGGDGDGFELNPTNAFADDASFATNNNGPADRHRYFDYTISIPAGCEVTGIEVRLDWWLDNIGGTSTMDVELSWDGGTTWTAAKTDTVETTTEHTATLGGSTDTWSRTWSVAETSDANFRVRITSNSSSSIQHFFLDWVPVKVYYEPLTSVQSGTATISSNGGTNTLTVAIASVDPAKSFLIFQTRHNGNRPVNSMIRGRIASATSVEFVRVSNEAAPGVPIDIQWYVVEIPSGVNVQRGEVTQSATTINVPVAAVAAVNQAFVTWSKTPTANDGNFSQDDPILCELTSTTNLQCRTNSVNASHTIWWQVIEFTNASDINVQKGTTSLLGTALSTTVTLGTPVDVTTTFILVGYRTAGTGADIGSKMLRAQLTNSTTVTIDRSISGTPDDITEIVWQAIELKDGSTVQRGSENFASGVAQKTVPITSVVTSRAVAFASVQPVGGQNMGLSPYAGDAIIGVCSVTMSLSTTQITMDRNNTAASCDVGWFAVEFAP